MVDEKKVEAPYTNEKVAVLVDPVAEAKPVELTKAEIEEAQRAADARSNYDPATEEKKNNERMFARERLEAAGKDVKVEREVAKKIVADAEAEFAAAKAKFDAAKASAEKVEKDAAEQEKADKAEAKKA